MGWVIEEAKRIRDEAGNLQRGVDRTSALVARLANVVAEIAEDVQALIERQDS
jgi:hypothetical protein